MMICRVRILRFKGRVCKHWQRLMPAILTFISCRDRRSWRSPQGLRFKLGLVSAMHRMAPRHRADVLACTMATAHVVLHCCGPSVCICMCGEWCARLSEAAMGIAQLLPDTVDSSASALTRRLQ